MGVFYYISSHENTKSIVQNENFEAIDKYVQSPETFVGPLDEPPYCDMGKQTVTEGYEWVDGAYQIASRAVQLGKENVLRHIQDKIFFDCIRDGNTYDLFVLATEEHQFHLINVLWEIACENGHAPIAKTQLAYAARRLMGYSELNEQDVIKQLPLYIKDGVDLSDLYHYSKYWEKPMVQKWLEDNCGKERLVFNDDECNHKLELSNFSKGGYQFGGWCCNLCSDTFEKETQRWFCKLCNNDVCCECYNKK